MPASPDTARPLIVRLPNHVGDVVMSVPALRHIEAQGYRLQLYGKGWAAPLLAGQDWPVMTRGKTWGERVAQLREWRTAAQAQDTGFNRRVNALAMPNSFSSALELRWAGLKPAGYAKDGRRLLLRAAWPANPPSHALLDFWGLACHLTAQTITPPADIALQVAAPAQAAADALLQAHGIAPGFICIVPYAVGVMKGQDKRWPGFAAFTQALAAQGKRQIVTCPGPGEERIAAEQHPGAISLTRVPLDVYLGVLKRAAWVVANDTGPAHMATAVGTPVLSVLGPTEASLYKPWGSKNRIVQGPGYTWPSVDEVLAALPG